MDDEAHIRAWHLKNEQKHRLIADGVELIVTFDDTAYRRPTQA